MIVGIDSNILIYAGVVPRSPTSSGKSAEQKDLTRRAKILLHDLRAETVVLPTVAIAEILVPVEPSKHGLLITALKEMFVCADFGERAASIAADLWAQYNNIPPDRKYEDRYALRADVKIIATAKAVGAATFYTNDDNCRALASRIMTAKGLPGHSEDLFIDQMLEEGSEETPKSTTRRRRTKRK